MIRRALFFLAGLLLLSAGVFFVYIDWYIFSTDVLPAISQGSLNVTTDSRILNVLWEGNEIYIVLAAYTLLAIGSFWGAFQLVRKAIVSEKMPPE